jgi:branched-subunit amino acid ABC-type transport system permease component
MALGLTLTMAVIKLPNFAHAELITVGAFTALVMSMGVSSNPLLVLSTAFLASALTALACHRIVYRPLAKVNTVHVHDDPCFICRGHDPPLHHFSVGRSIRSL